METINWSTQIRRVRDLIPYPQNPRKMGKDQARQLMNSLKRFNYVELVVINLDNTIIAGHMRIKAMQELGWGAAEVEVRVPDRQLSDIEAREYLIRSNKNTGDWDDDILAGDFDANLLHEWGFTAEELTDLLDLDIKEENDNEEEDCKKCETCGQKIKPKKEKFVA